LCQSGTVSGSSSAQFDVVVVGSANLDLVASVEELPRPGQTLIATGYAEHAGGKGLNQAVACARMGAKTAFVGCIGSDDAGAGLRAVLEREGIDTSRLIAVDAPTGRAFINVDSHGENAIVVVSGANASVGVATKVELPSCRVVLAQLEVPLSTVEAVFASSRTTGAITVLNPAPARPLPAALLAECDVVAPNETESAALGGTKVLLAAGVKTVVTTLGADGAQIETSTSMTPIAPFPVTPIDTVGAGDAFIGAMCAELARGSSIEDACGLGAIAGALATTVRGAVPSLPTREAVLKARR
jgi:ribokinase